MESPFSDTDWLDTAAQTLDIAIEKGVYDQFRQCQSDFDRVYFMSQHVSCLLLNTFERYLTNRTSVITKNPSRAVQYRKQGNDYFVNKNLSRAAWCYRVSIALSTSNSQDMALSYGNLSAVLFELNRYHESIRAIQLASDFYPNELQFKLVFRRAACYHKLNDPQRSNAELKRCRDLIKQTTGLDRKKIEAFCKEMDQLSQQTALLTRTKEEQRFENLDYLLEHSSKPSETLTDAFCSSKQHDDDLRPLTPPSPPRTTIEMKPSKDHLYKGDNKLVPCASSALRVIYTKEKGRHMITTEDVPPDALILTERPYACLLLPKFVYTYCDYCLTVIVIPYVCPQCSHVLFCSEHCQQRALTGYHRYECSYIHVLKTLGIGFLAYRTLTSTNIDTVRQMLMIDANNLVKYHEKHASYQSDYFSVQRLITHTDQMSTDDLFHYSLTAYFLSEIIRLTTFLPVSSTLNTSNEEQTRLAALLLKHIQQMICNAQTISITTANQCDEIATDVDDVDDEDHQDPLNKRFASAIFPTCALMNHSCVPNIRCVFEQGFLHVQASRWIKKGEEIFNCYGPQKSLMPSTEQRQRILFEQYFFKCQCEACDSSRTTSIEKSANGRKMKTSSSSNKSNHQRSMHPQTSDSRSLLVQDVETIRDENSFYKITSDKLLEAKRLFTQSLSSFTQDQTSWEPSLVLLENSIRLYERIIREINLDTVHLYEYVASIYNDQHQFELTCIYLHKCISILKVNLSASCSSNTILLVDVLRKYAQTLFHCRKFDDARRTIAEAQLLLDRISPISLNEEDPSNTHVLQTIEDLKAKCDLCIG